MRLREQTSQASAGPRRYPLKWRLPVVASGRANRKIPRSSFDVSRSHPFATSMRWDGHHQRSHIHHTGSKRNINSLRSLFGHFQSIQSSGSLVSSESRRRQEMAPRRSRGGAERRSARDRRRAR